MEENLKSKNYSALPHILVVDDDARIRSLVCRYLGEHGFVTIEAEDAAYASDVLQHFDIDAMVVDIMMPGESGLDFTKRLRADRIDIPVVLLTALGDVDDRITGFEVGADDYLPKPFEPKELVLRLQALLRRAPAKTHENDVKGVRLGRWVFDPQYDEIFDPSTDHRQKLTEAEAVLLRALVARAGEVCSRESLSEDCSLGGGERTIDVQVTRLRRKIEVDTKSPRIIQTVRGKGYLLRAEDV